MHISQLISSPPYTCIVTTSPYKGRTGGEGGGGGVKQKGRGGRNGTSGNNTGGQRSIEKKPRRTDGNRTGTAPTGTWSSPLTTTHHGGHTYLNASAVGPVQMKKE